MWEIITTIAVAIIGSNLIQFFVTRRDNKKGVISEIKELLAEIQDNQIKDEKDKCRIQMLVLIALYPHRTDEIMILAEHYFGTLNGDWWLTDLFDQYLHDQGLARPAWFKGGNKNE